MVKGMLEQWCTLVVGVLPVFPSHSGFSEAPSMMCIVTWP